MIRFSKIFFISIILIVLITTIFVRLIDSENFDFGLFKTFSANNINGAKVFNNTNQEIKIAESNAIKIIPPYTFSEDMHIINIQNILIEQPTIFEDKLYNYGCIRLCGCSTFKITINDNNIITIRPSSDYHQCKEKRQAGWHKNMEF